MNSLARQSFQPSQLAPGRGPCLRALSRMSGDKLLGQLPGRNGGSVAGWHYRTCWETATETGWLTVSPAASLAEHPARSTNDATSFSLLERAALGRALHDRAAPDLTAMSFLLYGLESGVRAGRAPAGRELARLRRHLESLSGTLSDMVREMRDPQTAARGGLQRFLADWQARTRLALTFSLEPRLWKRLDPGARLQIHYIVAEALTNIERHAREARQVLVMLAGRGQGMRLVIADDGIGLHAAGRSEELRRNGLAIMRERAALMGGHMRMVSRPGHGIALVFDFGKFGKGGGNHD